MKGIAPGKSFLVGVHLARAHGLRPTLELWTTALDLLTQEYTDGPGDVLLQALAQGDFQECIINEMEYNFIDLVEKIEVIVSDKQLLKKKNLEEDNKAIAYERAKAKQLSLQNKVDSAKRTLAKVVEDNRDIRVINMNQARFDRLTKELDETLNFSQNHKSHLTVEAIAYAVVVGN